MKRSLDGPTPATGVEVSPALPLYHWYEAAPVAKAMRYVCDPAAMVALAGWMANDGGVHWPEMLTVAMLLFAMPHPFVTLTQYDVACVSADVVKVGLFGPTG